ncbi:MAG: ChaN family lipoprotein [Pseudomonadota bacterium]
MIRAIIAAAFLASPAVGLEISAEHDIVILGEVHDNGLHHQGQADLIRKLDPKAVVFEMLSPEQADMLNAMPRENMDDVAQRLDWTNSGWPGFSLYRPIFEALSDRPAIGAAAPREQVRRAFGEGAAAVFGAEAEVFGLTQAIPEDQLNARKELQFSAHCEAMPLDMMGGMVEAQRFRDAAFAAATLAALEAYGSPIVLIAGNGHARIDWGVPFLLETASPETSVLSIGFVETPGTADDPRFHHTIVTDPAERGDPCDAFKS